jgi:hypothetical protein
VVCCREIRAEDLGNIVDLLARGFDRTSDYWSRALQRLADHPTPPNLPKYGYVLDDEGDLVGVVLLIATSTHRNGGTCVRCNVSSWYVEPNYRIYGSLLSKRAIRQENTTFFNVSPAPHTWPILEKQGFQPFATGRIIAIPALGRPQAGVTIRAVGPDLSPGADLDPAEIDILMDHHSYGCISLICEADGRRHPFVFGRHLRYGFFPVAYLVYCRDIAEFFRFAGPIGRFLARRGYAFVIFDATGPMRGIVGKYFGHRPRYRKGGDLVRLGDVAYSEQVMFGY